MEYFVCLLMVECSGRTVGVRLWELGEFHGNETRLPPLIDLDWIHSPLALTTVSIGPERQKVWATVDLAKVHFCKKLSSALTSFCSSNFVM